MEDCIIARKQTLGDWIFVTAYPAQIITPPSGGNVGVASVKCIFFRPVLFWFNCCNYGFFPVHGTEWGTADPGPGNTMPVISIGMPLPIQGILGEVANALGVSLTIVTWFQNQKMANATCNASAVSPVYDHVTVPKCDRSSITLPWFTWPRSAALSKLPEEE